MPNPDDRPTLDVATALVLNDFKKAVVDFRQRCAHLEFVVASGSLSGGAAATVTATVRAAKTRAIAHVNAARAAGSSLQVLLRQAADPYERVGIRPDYRHVEVRMAPHLSTIRTAAHDVRALTTSLDNLEARA